MGSSLTVHAKSIERELDVRELGVSNEVLNMVVETSRRSKRFKVFSTSFLVQTAKEAMMASVCSF